MDLQEAAEIAKKFIIEMNGEQKDLQLVAVVRSPDTKRWEATYSFSKKLESLNNLQKALGFDQRRVFKKVVIDNENKEIIGYSDLAYERSEVAE